jgi:molecular chaperone DnaJ
MMMVDLAVAIPMIAAGKVRVYGVTSPMRVKAVPDIPTIAEAGLGARIEIPTVDGPASMRVPPETSSGQTFRLAGKGVPHLKGGGRGDQFVTVTIVIPRALDRYRVSSYLL